MAAPDPPASSCVHAGGPTFRDEMLMARSYTRAHGSTLEMVHDMDFNVDPAVRFKADSTVSLVPADQRIIDTSAGPAGAG